MAVSCPEVMYGAYYPYLYGRGAARLAHHHHFQYDRFNVQSGGVGGGVGNTPGDPYGSVAAAAASSTSSEAQSPASPQPSAPQPPLAHLPHRLRAKEEDLGRTSVDNGSSESEGECAGGNPGGGSARAQYVSANCVVFTHYSGDVAAVVDEHFARALSVDKAKESVPMVSRNLPASFFNAAASAPSGNSGMELYEYDPWHQHYGGYGAMGPVGHAGHLGHVSHHSQYHHQHMAGYGPLLLGRSSLHHQYKPVEWGASQHHLDPAACSPYSYPAVPGLEGQVQDGSKDLYWF